MGLVNETERSRTSDLQIRNLTLYPAELQSRIYGLSVCGAGGIRTPDTLLGYNSLAGSHLRPLGHHSKFCQMAKIAVPFIRSRGDSNPRIREDQRFSRPPLSTAQPPLHKDDDYNM